MDTYTRGIRLVFLATFLAMCLQYVYAVIAEEPYPSALMPSFAYANIENNQTTYTSVYFSVEGMDTSYTVPDFFPGFSQQGARKLLDKAFFPAGNSGELSRKDELIIRFLGRGFYDALIAPFQPAAPDLRQSFPGFEQWLCHRATLLTTDRPAGTVYIHKLRIRQDMIQKNILQQDTIATYAIYCTALN